MDSFLHPSFSDCAGHAPGAPQPSAVTPHFAYTEIFEGGAVYHGISAGRGKFIAVEHVPRAVAFAVAKDRVQETITMDIKSDPLRRTISNALGVYFGAASLQSPDVSTLLDNYSALKRHLETLHSLLLGYPETLEFRLLVEDLLPDRAVFDGLGMEKTGGPYVLSQAQRRDLHERSIDTGLDVLDDTFRLGIMPFDVTEDTLRALSIRYAQKALPDGLPAPGELSVPEALPETPAPRYDPVFPSGVEAEQPASYKSFSNLALRIKGHQTGGSSALDTPENLADPVDHFPKVGSPPRSDSLKGINGYAADDFPGADDGVLTSLSALESPDVAVGVGGTAPIHRTMDIFHTGIRMGPVPPAMSAPLDSNLGEYFTSRSEGIPETDFDPLFLGARDVLSPAASLPTTATTGITGINGSFLDRTSTEGKSAHMLRQQLGRDLIAALTGLCRSVRDAVGRVETGSLASTVSAHFASFIRVWGAGINAFRRVINNHPPRGLLEVLDCLVVASAMCAAAGTCSGQVGGSMYFEFVNDLGRWRSLLVPDEHPLFDRIALALWLSVGLSDPTPERTQKDGLSRFQELIQDLVIQEPHPRAAVHSSPSATPLSAIQREHALKEEQTAQASGAVSIPIPGGGARKRVYDEALDADEDGDGFSISDVFDVERFLERSVGDESDGGALDLGWNDILSTTALLLASTAFSVFLTLTTVIHRDFNADSTLSIWRRPAGYKRSCAVLEDFIDSVGGKRGGARGAPPYGARSLDQGIRRLSLSTMSAPSAESRAHRERMRARASVAFVPPQTSHSLGPHPAPFPPPPPRLRCQYAGCAKTFSSVSNRNKHMREGCQRGGGGAGERRAGYRCRREGCARVLTTKWYRNTHEAERCRFRGAGKGQGQGGWIRR